MNYINNNVLVFIIAGKSEVGKDTTANIIKEYATKKGLKTINLQFSKYIKMYAKEITNWDGTEENKPRKLLQDIGNDIRKYIDKYFFINRIIDDIKVCSHYYDIVTISDTRLPEELDTISKEFTNSYKIRIIRPGYENNLSINEQNHITEKALDNYHKFDYIFINDKTINDLKNKVIKELKNIIKE